MKTKKISLKTGMLLIIILCWLVPIAILMSLSGFLLGRSYQESAEQMIRASTDYAVQQVQRQLRSGIEDSKAISYDGVIRSAYRGYLDRGDRAELHRKVDDYITRKFSRSQEYRAVFVNFWDPQANTNVYLLNGNTTGYGLLQDCREKSVTILEIMEQADTDVIPITLDGNLYIARNLVNSQFKPYATVVLMVDPRVVFAPLDGLTRIEGGQIRLDDVAFFLGESGNIIQQEPVPLESMDIRYYVESNGHQFSFCADFSDYNLLRENPWLLLLGVTVGLMVLPLLIVVIYLFRQHISGPAEVLGDANQRVESGDRGYEITAAAPNAEFSKLFSQFNAMSKELKVQFERAVLEQQTTQKAQIKALQSQINPHFLNNTLEVINWEARLSGNDNISEMIEALSTMLGAALDRKGRTQIPLEEELSYVDAYLKIIKWRMGDSFHVFKDVDKATLPVMVPRLILQPIAENAVEHDIAHRHEGSLWVRSYASSGCMVVELEHDGILTPEDKKNITRLIREADPESHVGLQNVSQRLKLIYGRSDLLSIEDTDHDTIVARICFPVEETAERNLP